MLVFMVIDVVCDFVLCCGVWGSFVCWVVDENYMCWLFYCGFVDLECGMCVEFD